MGVLCRDKVDLGAVDEIVDHVKKMQHKYGFKSDVDSVRGAVEESIELLCMELNENEIILSCDKILGRD